MNGLEDRIGHELEWVQPHALQLEFELRDGEEVLMTMRFRGLLSSFATAESPVGAFTFKRVGFWIPRVTIRHHGSEETIATFRNNTWTQGGSLEFADGRTYHANSNSWMSEYQFKREDETAIVHFRSWWRSGGT